MAIDLNTDLSYAQPQQAKLASALDKFTQEPSEVTIGERKTILGNGPSVTISNASGIDFGTIVSRLNVENSETKANSAKSKLGGVFAVLASRARESGNVSAENMDHLDNIEGWENDKAANDKSITGNNTSIAYYKEVIKNYNDQIAKINEDLKTETDSNKIINMTMNKLLLESLVSSYNAYITNLESKNTELEGKKKELDGKISKELTLIDDANIIRELAEALRLDAGDVTNLLNDYKEKERGVDEEKFLENHNPVKILQDAIAHHDAEMLEDIESKKDMKA